MAIGIYSGTFNPIHEGHVLFAQVASEQFGLDTVLFMPEPKPRYKDSVSSLDDRIAMATLALADAPHMKVHDVPGLESHTIKGVLENVATAYPNEDYVILMGADVFMGMGSWGSREDEDGSIQDIGEAVGFVVGVDGIDEIDKVEAEAEKQKLEVRILDVPISGLSSSKIRTRVASGGLPVGVHDDVKTYIETIGLYKK